VSQRTEQFLAKAKECAELATLLSNPKAKKSLEAAARRWLKMAKRIDQDERKDH
jgi:hypothetical protein